MLHPQEEELPQYTEQMISNSKDMEFEEGKDLPPCFFLHLRGEDVQPTHPVKNPSKIVLLHGFMQSHKCWLTTARRLRNRYGHSVVLIDFYGHGFSPSPRNYKQLTSKTLTLQVRNVLEKVDWTNEPLCFAGISVGGAIAQQYMLMFPENVSRIMLLASAGLSEEGNFSLANYFSRITKAALNLIDRIRDQFNIEWFFNNTHVNKVLGALYLLKDTPDYDMDQTQIKEALKTRPLTAIGARFDFVHPPQFKRLREANEKGNFMIMKWMDHTRFCSRIDGLQLHQYAHFWAS